MPEKAMLTFATLSRRGAELGYGEIRMSRLIMTAGAVITSNLRSVLLGEIITSYCEGLDF